MASNAVFVTVLFGLLACASAGMIFISAADDNPIPSNPCAEGPSYWCQNIANAKSCRATKHCIQTVWERQTISDDNDDICQVCKDMVQQARDQLLSNETQEDLKQVFEGSCDLMPVKMVRMRCYKMVDEFIPELIEMLASQMNPTMVCTTALLCNNAWVDGLLNEYKDAQSRAAPAIGTGKCETCQAFIESTSQKIQRSSIDDVHQILSNICGHMDSYSDACMAIIGDNIESIYKVLQLNTRYPTDVCRSMNLCNIQVKPMRVSVRPMSNDKKFESKFGQSLSSSIKTNDDLECQFCEALIKNVRNIMVANTTEAEFIQILTGLCKQTGSFAQQCQALVDQYGEMAYSFVMNELDPEQTCRLLTICSSGNLGKLSEVPSTYLRIQPADSVKAEKLTPAKKADISISNDLLIGQDEANAIKAENWQALPAERLVPASISILAPRKPGCMLCEYVMNEIVNELHNITVKEEIESAVKNICKKLPNSISEECGNLIGTYGDAIFFLLSQELDPASFCVQLQLCTGDNGDDIKLPEHPFKAPEVEDPNACALCEFVITMLDRKLKDNRTEESIKEALETVCMRLPKNVQKDCGRLVDAYSEEIVEMLLTELKPDEVCAALKLCQPKSDKITSIVGEAPAGITVGEFLNKIGQDVPAKSKKAPYTNTPMCVMCEFAMATLEKRLITNSTEDNVKRSIDFLCAQLPSTVADMCIDFVEQYGDEIFELLTSQIAPKAVCTQLGLCTPLDKSPRLLGHRNEQKPLEFKLPSKCEICEIVVEYLDKLLADDTIEESIDRIIEKACVVIPRGAQDRCTSMVETYGPYLISQIGLLMDKTKVCQSLHLCKPPPGQVQLLGGKQCTWGPAYWCVSPQHADACNALEHCQTKVWMKSAP